MFKTDKDRGQVLLAVRVHQVGWMLFHSTVLVCLVALAVLLRPKVHGWKFLPGLSFPLVYLSQVFDYLFHPWVKFHEGGVMIPPNGDANFEGGAVRIPKTERLAVDQIMGTKLAVQ